MINNFDQERRIWPDNFYSNHENSVVDPHSVRAQIMARKNLGVTLSDRAVNYKGRVMPNHFAEYVTPTARRLVHRVEGSPEMKALAYIYIT